MYSQIALSISRPEHMLTQSLKLQKKKKNQNNAQKGLNLQLCTHRFTITRITVSKGPKNSRQQKRRFQLDPLQLPLIFKKHQKGNEEIP